MISRNGVCAFVLSFFVLAGSGLRLSASAVEIGAPRFTTGDAVRFDPGALKSQIPNSAGLIDVTKPFTIEAWLRPHPLLGTRTILAGSAHGKYGPETRWELCYVVQRRQPVVHFGNKSYGNVERVAALVPPTEPRWMHVAICSDGETVASFVDGQPGEERALGKLSLPGPGAKGKDFLNLFPFGGFDVRMVRVSTSCRYHEPFQADDRWIHDETTSLLFNFSEREAFDRQTAASHRPLTHGGSAWIQLTAHDRFQPASGGPLALRFARGQRAEVEIRGPLGTQPLIGESFKVETWCRWKSDERGVTIIGNLLDGVGAGERSRRWRLRVRSVDGEDRFSLEYANNEGEIQTAEILKLPAADRWRHVAVLGWSPSPVVLIDGQHQWTFTPKLTRTPVEKVWLACGSLCDDDSQRGYVDIRAIRAGSVHDRYEIDNADSLYWKADDPVLLPLSLVAERQSVLLLDFSRRSRELVDLTGHSEPGSISGGQWIEADESAVAELDDVAEAPTWAGGDALRLQGDAALEIADSRGLIDVAKPFTVEAWVRPHPDVEGEHPIVDSLELRDGVRVAEGHCDLRFVNRAGDQSLVYREGRVSLAAENFAQRDFAWRHVAIAADGKTRTIYLDGKRHASRDLEAAATNTKARLTIGRGANFDLRAVRISSACRYRQNFTPPPSLAHDDATLVLYDFSKRTGSEVIDRAGKHPIALTGGRWITLGKNDDLPVSGGPLAVRLAAGEHLEAELGRGTASAVAGGAAAIDVWCRWNVGKTGHTLLGNLHEHSRAADRVGCWRLRAVRDGDQLQGLLEVALADGSLLASSPVSLPDDRRWHLVSVWVDNHYAMLLVDGERLCRLEHKLPFAMRPTQIYIGAPQAAARADAESFVEVQGFRVAERTPSRRFDGSASMFTPASTLGQTASTVALWDFSHARPVAVADWVGRGAEGKLVGGTWIDARSGEPVDLDAQPPSPARPAPALVKDDAGPRQPMTFDLALYAAGEGDATRPGAQQFVVASPLQLKAGGSPEKKRNTLAHELVRQALLATARHELGLVTRDAALGEAAPKVDDLQRLAELRVELEATPGDAVQVRLLKVAAEAPPAIVWEDEVALPVMQAASYQTALVAAERWSRESAVALKAQGFIGHVVPPRATAAAPELAKASLPKLDHLHQFIALRQLHRDARTHGESPELIAALAQGYANLGLLSEHHWGDASKAFRARSLVYAQRLAAAHPKAPLPLWLRGYAWALAGVPAFALDDVAAGDKLAADGAADARPAALWRKPAWRPLVLAYCRCDAESLQAHFADAELAPLASLLNYLVYEDPWVINKTLSAGKLALRANPAAFRVIDGMFNLGGVSNLHRVTAYGPPLHTRLLRAALPLAEDLPEGVPAALEEAGDFAQTDAKVIEALRRRDRTAASEGECSWQIAAHLIEEEYFGQVWMRAAFMRFSWSVPVDDFLRSTSPLVAEHPRRKLVSMLGESDIFLAARLREIADKLPASNLPVAAQWKLIDMLSRVDPAAHSKLLEAEKRPLDSLANELKWAISSAADAQRLELAQRLLVVAPHSPIGIGVQAQYDRWLNVQDRTELVAKYLKYPSVMRGLIDARNIDAKDKARYLAAYITASPDYEQYWRLAQYYRRTGDTERWLETLNGFLAQSEQGLEHARVREELAKYYAGERDFERAIPYAEAAAETYAAWAMLTAVEIHEQAGNLDQAQEWHRRAAERYPSMRASYTQWCKKHGRDP